MTIEDDLRETLGLRADRDAPEAPSVDQIRAAARDSSRPAVGARRMAVGAAAAAVLLAGGVAVVARAGDDPEVSVQAGEYTATTDAPQQDPEMEARPWVGVELCPSLAILDRHERQQGYDQLLAQIEDKLASADAEERAQLEFQRSNLLDEPVGVGGPDGETVGFVRRSAMDESQWKAAIAMCADGHLEEGGFPPKNLSSGLVEAYRLLEAAEVRTEAGELVGYMPIGSGFVSLDEHRARFTEAKALVASNRDVPGLERRPEYGEIPLGERAVMYEALARSLAADEPQEVFDDSGSIRGSYRPSAKQARNARLLDRLKEDGVVPPSAHGTVAFSIPPDVLAAYRVIEPIPVSDTEGELVGYVTFEFVDLDDYERVLADAVRLLDQG